MTVEAPLVDVAPPSTTVEAPLDTVVPLPTRDPDRRRAERVMGTVVSLFAPSGDARSGAADRAVAWLREVDRRFSPFRPESEVSRYMRGEVDRSRVSPDLAEVLELSDVITDLSGGAFDISRHRADGRPDPTGLVKGWATDRAADVLTAGGIERFCLGVGGDVIVRGGRSVVEPWRIGIVDPADRTRVILTLIGRDLAVATSGGYERGEHIVDGRTGARPPDGLSSLSVAGPRLTHADAYATAAFAMGREGLRWCASLPGYAACALTLDGRLLVTDAMSTHLEPAPS